MPQFDKITFFNQVFWLFVFFAGFYLTFLKIFLPKLSSILKARHKKLSKGASNVTAFANEQNKVTAVFHDLIENIASTAKNLIINSTEKMTNWISSSLKTLNEEKLKKSNHLMEKSLHKQIVTTFFFSNM